MGFFRNPDKLKFVVWFCASVLATVLTLSLLPFALPQNAGTPGYNAASSFSCCMPVIIIACLAFVGFLFSISFLWSSFKLDKLLAGKDALVNWEYSVEEISRIKMQVRAGEEKTRNRVSLYFFFIMLIFGVICATIEPTANVVLTVAWVIGIWLLVVVAAFVLQKVTSNADSSIARQVLLSRYGVLFCGAFHIWSTFASRLSSISLDGAPGQKTLRISYAVASEHGEYYVKVEIPVPAAREGDVTRAIEELQVPLLKKFDKLRQAGINTDSLIEKKLQK